jgi:hypothetical protein
MYEHLSVNIYVCICVYTYIYMYICTYYVYMYIYMYVFKYAQGSWHNKQVHLAQTQRYFIHKHHTQFTKYNNDFAVNKFTWTITSAVILVGQCLTPTLQIPSPNEQLKCCTTTNSFTIPKFKNFYTISITITHFVFPSTTNFQVS